MAQRGKGSKARNRDGGIAGTAAIAAGIGAACALAIGAFLRLRGSNEEEKLPAAALKHGGAPGPVGTTGNVRSAGRGGMRDPPADWDKVDEAADQSYPASDPPSLAPHVD